MKENVMLEGRIIILKGEKKDTGYYFIRKRNKNNDDIDFNYDKGEKMMVNILRN